MYAYTRLVVVTLQLILR